MPTMRVRSDKHNRDPFSALRYSPKPASRSTVRRQYAIWRSMKGIAPRCDIPQCVFHTGQLKWLGSQLPLILDHANGNNLDNSLKNLRYLCPNCESQLSTRGGKNRGRVLEAEEGTYVLLGPNGSQNRVIVVNTAAAVAQGHRASIECGPQESAA